MVVMSVVYSLSSYPAGALSDRVGRVGLLVAGLIVLVIADLVLAFLRNWGGHVNSILLGKGSQWLKVTRQVLCIQRPTRTKPQVESETLGTLPGEVFGVDLI